MTRVIASPNRYIQGKGELKKLASHIATLGTKAFVIVDTNIENFVRADIEQSIQGTNISIVYESFKGECSMQTINRITQMVNEKGIEVIIGVGGGKTLDTSKAVAYYSNKPVVIVPTAASSDAPCSSLAVIYQDNGVFEKYLHLPSSPNMIIVDSEIICNAPVRLLCAGMGDALATYFEARACYKSDALNSINGKSTEAAQILAKLCYETLLKNSQAAILAVSQKLCTKEVENLIEANIYLSCIGFESGGLAAAHAINNGLTVIDATHKILHGEKVAFGTIVQLVLEKAPHNEIERVISFCQSVNLPITLAELNIKEIKPDEIMEVARLACSSTSSMGNMPFEVTVEDVYTAIIQADEIGRSYKQL